MIISVFCMIQLFSRIFFQETQQCLSMQKQILVQISSPFLQEKAVHTQTNQKAKLNVKKEHF